MAQTVAVTPKIEPHCGLSPGSFGNDRLVAVTPKIEPHCGTADQYDALLNQGRSHT